MKANLAGARPGAVYEAVLVRLAALRDGEASPMVPVALGGDSAGCALWATGHRARRELPVEVWMGGISPADESILARCTGPTLDVGCGPGRLAAALAARRIPALGIDITPFAVALARRAGASALCRDVFGPVPGSGRWHEVLLIDGNIGIGGHPRRLLARVARLVAPGGSALVELDPPGMPTGAYWTRLEAGGVVSAPFRWAGVSVDGIVPVAAAAGFTMADTWHRAGRYFAQLTPATNSAARDGTHCPI